LLIGIAVIGYLLSRSITAPISQLTGLMGRIAEGELDTEVQGADRLYEVGAMGRAVEVFKQNARKMQQMTEGERAASEHRRLERTIMMQALQGAFGEVVDAAVEGDFSKRVEADFPDRELNSIAASINNLV